MFHVSALRELDGSEPQLPARLISLVRKELIGPSPSQVPGDEAYRFRHVLICDAAYDALPKAVRADFHEQIAAWLDGRGSGGDADDIVGHHLEQAARYKQEPVARTPRSRFARVNGSRPPDVAPSGGATIVPPRLSSSAHSSFCGRRASTSRSSSTSRARRKPSAGRGSQRPRPSGPRHRRRTPARRCSRHCGLQQAAVGRGSPDEVDACANEALPLLDQAGDHA